MRRLPLRSALTVVAAVMLLAPAAAFGQTDDFEVHGEGEGFLLSIPEIVDIGGGNTEADLTSDPTAHAWGAGFLLSEDSISEVTIERDGVSERDPSDGQNCGGPDLPEPLDLADLACSVAEGDTTGSTSSASASATGAEISVGGDDITALVEFLVGESNIEDAIDAAQDEVLIPLTNALAEACLALWESELGEALIEGADELRDAINEQGEFPIEVTLESGDACDLLVTYLLTPPVITDDPVGALQAILEQALAGTTLLDITLAGSEASGVETSDDVTGAASAIGVDIALPSLNVLGNVIEALTGLVDEFLLTISEDIADVDLGEYELPEDSSGLVDTILDNMPVDLRSVLDSDQPLLTITGGQAEASATYDRASEDVTTEGTVAPLVIDLNDALAELLQLSDQDPITIPEGGSETFAEDTPLESTATLAACTSEEEERNGLPGEEIHCAGLDLVLLKGVIGDDEETEEMDGGVRVAGAAVTASAFGAAAPAPSQPEEPLPTTGGGAALFGVVALAGAFGLRRWKR